MKFYSQCGQDEYVVNYFKDKKGYYVDIGANNGVTGSNTKILEELGWCGICIEPNPEIYKELIKNRTCKCIEGAVSDLPDEYLDFCKINGYSEMLSGLLHTYNEDHKRRILSEQQIYGGTREKIKVRNYNFNVIENTTIDYLSIDTEGSELNILKCIDFDKYKIKLITVENNYNTEDLKNFLVPIGFKLLTTLSADEVYENTL